MKESGRSALEARNEAFRRLGRNLYLFQLIEQQLKHLVVHSSISGHVEELPDQVATKTKAARKTAMGALAEQFATVIFSDHGGIGPNTVDSTKPSISFSFRVEADEQFVKQRKKELKRLVIQRNRLVHNIAADIQPDDTAQWLALGVFLDEQRVDLIAEYDRLRLLLKELSEAAQESVLAIESALFAPEHT